ncbi:MAG: hypothetical protein QM778_06630 [Myxococcales bacterium]
MLWLVLAGCRFGGSGGDALALVEPQQDAGRDGAVLEPSEPEADGDDDPDPEDPVHDASKPEPRSDGAVADASSRDDAGQPEQCVPAAVTGCDPVRNTGCTAGVTQCTLDPQASPLTGRCVFSGLPATPCGESALSTTCPPQQTCVAGACRTYCFCDSDCAAGERCNEGIAGAAARGVSLCAPADY